MKITAKKLAGMVVLFFCTQLYADTPPSASDPLTAQLDKIVATFPTGTVSSIIVQNAATGAILYSKNADQNLMPASVQKILTAVAAYDVLGPKFRFSTQLLMQGDINSVGILKGDIQLLFGGDPSLKRKNIRTLLAYLKEKGIKQIDGTVWLNGTAYSGYSNAEGVSWEDLKIAFGAPSTAIILNRNCFYAVLKPASTVGEKASIKYDSPDWPFRLENNIVTVSDSHKACNPTSWESKHADYRLEGCITKGSHPLRMAFAVKNPEKVAEDFVKKTLKQLGITHHGKVIIGKPNKPVDHLLIEHKSEPLPDLLRFMLERSDNLYADSMLKTLGLYSDNKEGSYKSGVGVLRTTLQKLGVNLGNSYFEDGSGLSRYNLLSASVVSHVLLVSWRKWKNTAPWLVDIKKKYWFKTGAMGSVRGIAGYVFNKNEDPKIFVILLNGLVSPHATSPKETYYFLEKMKDKQLMFMEQLLDKKEGDGKIR